MGLKFQKIFYLRHRKIYAVVILAFQILLLLSIRFYWQPGEDVSCFYTSANDTLPSGDHITPASNSIFFHETSCNGTLNWRQTCAIESAARTHPDYQITVFFNAPVTKAALDGPPFTLLSVFANIKLVRLHILDYTKGTFVEQLVRGNAFRRSRYKVVHASDILRYVTLYKFGGIYLDLDVVVAKRLSTLANNWSARESYRDVAAGAMAFSRDELGRTYALAAMRELQTNFRSDLWGHNGPGVITRILKRKCYTQNVTLMSAATCEGFEVYGVEKFYPIAWKEGKKYFLAGDYENKDAYAYHVWNDLTKNYKVHPNSPYANLARKYCPTTYELYGKSFGT